MGRTPLIAALLMQDESLGTNRINILDSSGLIIKSDLMPRTKMRFHKYR